MKLIKSLLLAVMVIVMTTMIGSALTQLSESSEQNKGSMDWLNNLLGIVHAEATDDISIDTPHYANHTFTTSLNTYTPSTVIDENYLPTPQNNSSQSPDTEGVEVESEYVNILANLVPISGEDTDYEAILGLSQSEIKAKIENHGMSIWEIAEEADKVNLLENAYYAIYPARIIKMLELEIITQQMADSLIEAAMDDIQNHLNTSVEVMIENMLNQDLS